MVACDFAALLQSPCFREPLQLKHSWRNLQLALNLQDLKFQLRHGLSPFSAGTVLDVAGEIRLLDFARTVVTKRVISTVDQERD